MPLSRLPGRTLLFVLATAAPLAAQSHRLGTIAFPNSGPKAAQPPFIRGVLLLHSFEYDDAAAAFREAQRLAPGFALAYWGEAMTQTHPVWNQQEVDSARAILARLGPTPEARSARARTRRERGYLEAVEILYGDGSKPRRDTLYSAAMGRLAAAYPSDLEARAFYALSLLGLSQGTRNVPTYMRAGALAEEVLRRNPDHPGAAHYVIHAFDDPAHAPLGLPAARAYSKIAPGAAHAQHMTSHIFVALGMWDETVDANVAALGPNRPAWTPNHVSAWLDYAYLQQGRHRGGPTAARERPGQPGYSASPVRPAPRSDDACALPRCERALGRLEHLVGGGHHRRRAHPAGDGRLRAGLRRPAPGRSCRG